MNHSDIRKHLKKGETAVDVLESLGYQYVANGKEHPNWVAPVNPLNEITKTLEELIASQVSSKVKAAQLGERQGPNWDQVVVLQGKKFSVMLSRIPSDNKLREYHPSHFANKQFTCLEIRYYSSPAYTGYAVLFEFNTKPFNSEIVWLPMSACAFSK